jgi:hypothetical protein
MMTWHVPHIVTIVARDECDAHEEMMLLQLMATPQVHQFHS